MPNADENEFLTSILHVVVTRDEFVPPDILAAHPPTVRDVIEVESYPWTWDGGTTTVIPSHKTRLFRISTDRNAGLIQAIKDEPRIYKPKLVDSKIGVKLRFYNYKAEKWQTKRVPGKIWIMVPEKRSLNVLTSGLRVANDLLYKSSTYNSVADADILLRQRWANPLAPDGYGYVTFHLRGSLLLLRKEHMQLDVYPYNVDNYAPPLGLETLNTVQSWSAGYNFEFQHQTQIAEVQEIALRRLFPKIKNSRLDLATALAESKQTYGLISDIAVQVGKAFLSLKKGKLMDAFKAVVPQNKGEAANAFLAFRYGAEPLMADVAGGAQQIAEFISKLRPKSIKAKHSMDFITEEPGSNAAGTWLITTKSTVTVKYAVFYDIDGEFKNAMSRLGFTSPVNVAWELVPFSFVLDWFLPIGNFLSSLSALEGYKLREIVKTVIVKQTVSCVFTRYASSSGYLHDEVTLKSEVENVGINRTVSYDATAIPQFPPLPRWRNPFTVGRAANAIALLTQMFKR